jgi:hypothetical protein
MADINVKNDKSLKYQQLENANRKNDFTEAKKEKKYLVPYSYDSIKNSGVSKQHQKHQKKHHYKTTNKPFKVPQATHEQTGISKTKMRKAIAAYWSDNFNIFYHPNNIKEFLSDEGFKTTPPEHIEVFNKNKDNKNFIGLVNLIQQFNDGKMDEDSKERFYKKLTKELVEA